MILVMFSFMSALQLHLGHIRVGIIGLFKRKEKKEIGRRDIDKYPFARINNNQIVSKARRKHANLPKYGKGLEYVMLEIV